MGKNDYNAQYYKENIKRLVLNMSRIYDQDIIDWAAAQSNFTGEVKRLIREQIARDQAGEADKT